ncbi:hypothetical protein HN371_03465 [Candidatus Poribacteria bacterium]|nr:hypothetical protein [Candidatus Poribacteria bacterium]MBT5533592.1 hypothetical protein [Candidatus Poribacteria bacterium]MBT5712956.1 hypothetical protein [Candidatus Poribacteria bacterium]MBT7100218.1 hypothetical protein [Candidatus Poribacteria bacterium]MBT7808437.1 hypothetical protein [Candidatus Poribacteria bacterium]
MIDIRPAPGGIICEGREVTVVFNRDPGDARCDEARLDPEVQTGSRRTFRADGGWRLSFAWDHGGALTVDYAAVICDYEEPILVAVTPEQGTLVTARELEASGIVLEFNAPVEAPNDQPNRAFRIAQVDGDAWDLAVSTAGRRVTLRVPAGVIEPGRSYVVTGAVTDERGNETEVALTYVTVAADE